jgi:hypothetical protein
VEKALKPIKALKNGIVIYRFTGDADPIEYGGGVVYETPRGEFFWEFWSMPDEHDMTYVYRIGIAKDVLKLYDFIDPSELEGLLEVNAVQLKKLSRSTRAMDRLEVLMCALDVYGPSSFSPCKHWEADKIRDRWGCAFSKRRDSRYTQSDRESERALRRLRGKAASRRL